MKALVLGSGGQLGRELLHTCPADIEVIPKDVPQVDFLDSASIRDCIDQSNPNWIINAAAYTAVDQAETDQEKAFRINHDAVKDIAQIVIEKQIRMAHISTDYVFSGCHYKPIAPDDPPEPMSVYGVSKWKGEAEIRKILKDNALIIRTAWLYSSHGKNFVKTMLNLMSEGKDLNVIDEQVGTPTWAGGLARAVWASIEKKMSGTYHWTDAGVASWYDFAVAIQEESLAIGLLGQPVSISPVDSSKFPTPAQRPFYSILDKRSFWKATGLTPIHWRTQLRDMLKELK